jgi:REP element-mobilizing transposase RayT
MPELKRYHPRRLSREAYAEPHRIIFVTVCAKLRRPIFQDDACARLVVSAARECCETERLDLVAYCVMPDHVHLVVATRIESRFEDFVGRLKSKVTRGLHAQGIPGTIWERSYWDRHAHAPDDVQAMVEYVLANPVRRGLCERVEEWPYACFVGLPW